MDTRGGDAERYKDKTSCYSYSESDYLKIVVGSNNTSSHCSVCDHGMSLPDRLCNVTLMCAFFSQYRIASKGTGCSTRTMTNKPLLIYKHSGRQREITDTYCTDTTKDLFFFCVKLARKKQAVI